MSSSVKPAKPVRSMTGYAQLRASTASGELTLTLRSVNHRGLDLHFQQPSELSPFETAMRALLKECIGRGHLEIRVSLMKDDGAQNTACNWQALKGYVETFRRARKELRLDGEPDLNILLGLPGVLGGAAEAKELDSSFQAELLAALHTAVSQLNESREREGRELAAGLVRELAEIERAAAEIQQLRKAALAFYQEKLREKLSELLAGSIPENRLAEEAALLAERSDIEEELTRLGVHTKEMRRMIQDGGAIGKPLDFLLQEMNRETNTTLSKSSSIGEIGLKIGNLALGIKANIERIREQALNLE
ncbi:MAG TPA: YicC/YloC family endoribonuclease [Bryobacteraceae bacterium]|jgi:uncharacterized protein (TIGR00255 family)